MKIQFKTLVAILVIVFSASCKPRPGSGGGGGGGSVPTADELKDYIDRKTNPENKTCDDVRTDIQRPGKFPIIYPSGEFQWKNEYSKSIADQFDKDHMRALKKQKINEGDLSLIGCKGYNYATDEEKKQFWILFLASVSKPESNFQPDQEYNEKTGVEETIPREELKSIDPAIEKSRGDGHLSMGMLQIDPKASNDWCGILSKEMNKEKFTSYDMHTPSTNLQCGLLMMQWQVMGVPRGNPMKPSRPGLVGRLFTPNGAWYWSNLEVGKNGEVIREFSVHAQRQFKFCNRANPIDGYTPGLSTRYKEMKCNEVQDLSEKENCEKYLVNAKLEPDQTDPRVGENPTDNTCRNIDNTSRTNTKTTAPEAEELDQLPIENIGK